MLVILLINPSPLCISIQDHWIPNSQYKVSDLINMVSRAIWQTNIHILTARGRNFRRARSNFLWCSPFLHLADGISCHNMVASLYFNSSTFQLLRLPLKIVSKQCQVCSPLSGVENSNCHTVYLSQACIELHLSNAIYGASLQVHTIYPSNTRHWENAGLMSSHCL